MLHSVAVVSVDVDVGDAVVAVVEQPRNRHSRIVVDAESRSPIRHRVVHAAADADRAPRTSRSDFLRCGQRAAGEDRTCFVHVREDRVVLGTEPVGNILAAHTVVRRVTRVFDRCKICRCVDSEEVGIGRGTRFEKFDALEKSEASRECHREIEASGIHRVIGAPPIAQVLRTPHHDSIRSRRRGVPVRSDRRGHGITLLPSRFVLHTTLVARFGDRDRVTRIQFGHALDSPRWRRHRNHELNGRMIN